MTLEEERLGFREPPDDITRSCLSYMGRIMEVREFISFYFTFVKTSQEFGKIVENSEQKESVSNKALTLTEYNFSKHRQLVNEIMLSRAVESFDFYILSILREIFSARPEILKSNKKIDISTLIELRTPEEIIFYLAENQLHELGYKPLKELNQWIIDRTGLTLFKNDDIFDLAMLATEVRNLIAHNDCMNNDVIMKRLGDNFSGLKISELGKVIITDEFLRKCCYALDGIVFDFDQLASEKFDLYRANRFGTFFIRE